MTGFSFWQLCEQLIEPYEAAADSASERGLSSASILAVHDNACMCLDAQGSDGHAADPVEQRKRGHKLTRSKSLGVGGGVCPRLLVVPMVVGMQLIHFLAGASGRGQSAEICRPSDTVSRKPR